MRVVVQRCQNARVVVERKVVGEIPSGIMLLVGFTEGDDFNTLQYMARKVVNLRIFPDDDGVMNRSLLDVGESILSVSQFTLYANTKKGNRPSYKDALGGDDAKELYLRFNDLLKTYTKVETGVFGASMEVEFTNVGPTTILLER